MPSVDADGDFAVPVAKRQKIINGQVKNVGKGSRLFSPFRVRDNVAQISDSSDFVIDHRTCFAYTGTVHIYPSGKDYLPNYHLRWAKLADL